MPREEGPELYVRGVNWLGDAVMSLPALTQLLSGSRGAVCARGAGLALYRAALGPETITLEHKKGLKNWLGLIKALRGLPLKRAVCLQNAFGAALACLLAGIKERAGYAADGRSLLLTRALPRSRNIRGCHEVFYYLNILRLLGQEPVFSFPEARSAGGAEGPPSPAAPALKELSEYGFILAAAPGATYGTAKRAPLALFADAAERILEGRGGALALLGGPAERPDAEKLHELVRRRGIKAANLAGLTTLPEAAALLKKSALLLANDSGLMHLGSAAGTPLVAFFGPTNPVATGPLGPESAVLRRGAPCSPCRNHHCPLKRRVCFDGVTAEGAFEAARRLLEKQAPDPAKSPKVLVHGGPEAALGAAPESIGPFLGRLPEDPGGALRAVSAMESLDPARSVILSESLPILSSAAKLGLNSVLWLGEGEIPEILKTDFLPRITAPSLPDALSYAAALFAFLNKPRE